MSELDWLREEWRRRDPVFRRDAAANALGSFAGGLGLALVFGVAAIINRYVDPWILAVALVAAITAWIFGVACDPKSEFTAAVMLATLVLACFVFLVSLVALIGRIALSSV